MTNPSAPASLCTTLAVLAVVGCAATGQAAEAAAAEREFDLPADRAAKTLRLFAEQAAVEVVFANEFTTHVHTRALQGRYTPEQALKLLLAGTGLVADRNPRTGAFLVRRLAPSAPPRAPPEAKTPAPPPATPKTAQPNHKESPPVKKRTFVALLTGWLLAAAPAANAQSTGTIEGRVLNNLTGTYLANVRIVVEGTPAETVTDANGAYRLAGVPAGKARVTASYVGLDGRTETVAVRPDRPAELNFELTRGGVVTLEKFVVIEQREQNAQTLALNQQRQSPNIKNVVASDEYPASSEDNIADFIRFIPGVSIQYSGRAGVETSLRGMPPDTSRITLNGTELAGSFAGGSTRAVSMLAVPTVNISTIEVTKVPTPDMPAAGLGGALNITTRSGFERAKPLFQYNVFSAFNPDLGFDSGLRKRTGPHNSMDAPAICPSFELSYVLPVNRSLAFSFSGSNRMNYDTNPYDTSVSWDMVQGFATVATLRNSLAQLVSTRSGQFGVDWKLGAKDVFRAAVTYRRRDADQGSNNLGIVFGAGATGSPTFTQGAATGVGSLSQSFTWTNLVNDTIHAQLKYTHFGETWRIDASGSYSYSCSGQTPDYNIGYFSSASTSLANLIIRADGMNPAANRGADMGPDTAAIRDRAGNLVDPHDGRLYTVSSVNSGDFWAVVDKAQFRLDLRREFRTVIPIAVQTGGTVQQEVFRLRNWGRTFNFRPSPATAADRVAGNYDLIDTSRSNAFGPLLGSRVQWISPAKLFELKQRNPEYFVLNEPLAHQTRVNNAKKIVETIPAAYLRADTRLLKKRLWLVGGVRYERTEDEGWGPLVNPAAHFLKNPNGSLAKDAAGRFIPLTTDPLAVARLDYIERGAHTQRSYDGLFPSLNASYSLKEDLVVRFGYAQTIGRPNLSFVIPGATYSTVTETSTSQTITVINSGLKPWTATNYDLSLESYMIKGGFGSIGVFQKDLRDFFTVTSMQGTPELLDKYGVVAAAGDAIDYTIVTRANGGDARVRGLELGYRQALNFLPHWARGVQVFANYTRSILSGSRTADFTGFNPNTLSWGVNYTRSRYLVKLFCTEGRETKRSAMLAPSATVPPDSYVWQGALKRYTLNFEYSFSRRLGFYASLGDFNSPGGLISIQKQGPAGRLFTTRGTEWGMSAMIGLKGEF